MRIVGQDDLIGNVARSAAACSGAISGGADSISVLPHTIWHGLPEGSARRAARDVQLLLMQEDTAAPGEINALTNSLAEQGWAEFQRIEQEGGILPSLKAGHIQARVKAYAETRLQVDAGDRTTAPGAAVAVPTLPAERHPAPTDGVVFCEALYPLRPDNRAA
jgi:methylmalonyl-CoA mutase